MTTTYAVKITSSRSARTYACCNRLTAEFYARQAAKGKATKIEVFVGDTRVSSSVRRDLTSAWSS